MRRRDSGLAKKLDFEVAILDSNAIETKKVLHHSHTLPGIYTQVHWDFTYNEHMVKKIMKEMQMQCSWPFCHEFAMFLKLTCLCKLLFSAQHLVPPVSDILCPSFPKFLDPPLCTVLKHVYVNKIWLLIGRQTAQGWRLGAGCLKLIIDWLIDWLIDLCIDWLITSEMAPSMSVNFISLVTSYVRLREEEPQTIFPMSITWVSHIADTMLMGC